jgi:(1->4)-alpha-D-glucan 1-alpha-D-glucosylmutase
MGKRPPSVRPAPATYRLQFNRGFRFSDAKAIVSYLRDLGVGELYASPVFQAGPGSPHGYDVTDPTRLNPELGAVRDFNALFRELRRHGLGLLLDIVPNHMAASPRNPWWADVLRRGRASRFAGFFDIDWEAGPDGRLVLPILGDRLDPTLERGELSVVRSGGSPVLRYHAADLPLAPGTCDAASADALRALNRDPSRLAELLRRQHYELAYWREGVRRINYRRFFDVTGLAGLRVEDPQVFEATHRLITRLAREGAVTGLRVDHVDGLRDPLQYLRRLRRAVSSARPRLSVLVEKILLGDEQLPAEWPADGTTGYEFADVLNALFVDPRGLKALDATYRRFTGSRKSFDRISYELKKRAIRELLPAELRDLTRRLRALAGDGSRAPTLRRCQSALVEVSACLPVYRTYIRDYRVSRRDRGLIERAVEETRRRSRTLDRQALAFLRRVLLLRFPASLPGGRRRLWLDFVMRWQQFTGPATAKGLEDTALYNYNRLVSLNVVGGDPTGAGVPDAVARFHRHNATTLESRPGTLNATSTHDMKRSEDVRARIDVLSEMPDAWARRLSRWARLNRGKKRSLDGRSVPDANEETLLYQTLVGAWPLDAEDVPEFAQRLSEFMVKAAREAKANTSWLDPNEAYEAALTAFVGAILEGSGGNEFLRDFREFHRRVAPCGALNSLVQTLLKIASPGRPDFYQGSELWDFSLVDPDNRRPVDFKLRRRLLRDMPAGAGGDRSALAEELLASWPDGRVKLYLTAEALAFRNREAELFASGRYVPLAATGRLRDKVIGFARERRGRWAVVAVPRLAASLSAGGRPPVGRRTWRETALALPKGAPRRWRDVLSGEGLTASGAALDCGAMFRRLPLAFLESAGP